MTKRNSVCVVCKKELTWTMENIAIYRNLVNEDLEFVMIGTKYRCSKCGATIVTDFGTRFSSTDYDQNYLKKVKEAAGESIELI